LDHALKVLAIGKTHPADTLTVDRRNHVQESSVATNCRSGSTTLLRPFDSQVFQDRFHGQVPFLTGSLSAEAGIFLDTKIRRMGSKHKSLFLSIPETGTLPLTLAVTSVIFSSSKKGLK